MKLQKFFELNTELFHFIGQRSELTAFFTEELIILRARLQGAIAAVDHELERRKENERLTD